MLTANPCADPGLFVSEVKYSTYAVSVQNYPAALDGKKM